MKYHTMNHPETQLYDVSYCTYEIRKFKTYFSAPNDMTRNSYHEIIHPDAIIKFKVFKITKSGVLKIKLIDSLICNEKITNLFVKAYPSDEDGNASICSVPSDNHFEDNELFDFSNTYQLNQSIIDTLCGDDDNFLFIEQR